VLEGERLLSAFRKVWATNVNKSIIVAVVLLGVLPLIPYVPHAIAIDVLIFGLLALGYNIVQGHMGQVSFGLAAFFGLGAYFAGLFAYHVDIPSSAAWIWLILSVAATGVVAFGMGAVVLRRRGAYFALTNLAFLQMFYYIILQLKDITGGDDGIWGISTPTFGAIQLTPMSLYYLCFVVFVVCLLLMKRMILDSPSALVLHAIRQDEARAQSLGYNVYGQMLKAYTLSGVFSGVAGAMYFLEMQYIGLSYLHWSLNGEVIAMVMLGGSGTFIGPLLGAAILIVLKDVVSMYTIHWMIIVGVLIMVVILRMREGILGAFKSLRF